MLNLLALKAWILATMLTMEPNAPWKDTYEKTAEAIASQSIEAPLFTDEDGRRTASVFVSLAWYEGTFKPDAEGDCTNKSGQRTRCGKGTTPHSFCTFQINDTNLKGLGVTKEELLTDINVCTEAARKMIHKSFQVCSGRPFEDRLSWYAAGKRGCVPNKQSRHRMFKARWIFDHFPLQEEVALLSDP